MKIYKNQSEVDADIKDGVLIVNEDVKFQFSLKVSASLRIAGNIDAGNINAGNINAWNIDAGNINAGDINARDINFFAVAFAYISFKCKSITGRRNNAKFFCLDKEVEITGGATV